MRRSGSLRSPFRLTVGRFAGACRLKRSRARKWRSTWPKATLWISRLLTNVPNNERTIDRFSSAGDAGFRRSICPGPAGWSARPSSSGCLAGPTAMKNSGLLFLATALILSGCVTHEELRVPVQSAPNGFSLTEARKAAATMQQQIDRFHSGHRTASNVLRVVYFCPNDAKPLPQWQERLERAIQDISDFYGEGMRRFGFTGGGLPVERKDGHVSLHLVRGIGPADSYDYSSGARTASEVRRALAGKVNLDREQVLVIYGLCRKEPDGRYVFHAPYYGGGSCRAGLAHAADCELLDPRLLVATNQHMVYTEHYYPRMKQTVAQFNSFYLGGIAHELGHGLGLSHDAGSPGELSNGTSLMADGNLHYREDRWAGCKPAALSFASALQLAAHPLFTGSNRDRWTRAKARFKSLTFSADADGLKITGKVTGQVEAYAVIAYLLRSGQKTDHYTLAYPAPVREGSFSIQVTGLPAGAYRLELASCHVNGEISRHRTRVELAVGARKSRGSD